MVTLILSSCSNKESDNTGTTAPTVQFTENIEITDTPQIEESDTTTVPTEEPTTTKKPKKQSSTSLFVIMLCAVATLIILVTDKHKK